MLNNRMTGQPETPAGASMFLQKLAVYYSTACALCYMIALNITIRIMHFISPSLTKRQILRMGEKITMTQNPNFRYEDWGPTFKSFRCVKTASQHMWLSLGQEAFVGGEAPDSAVVRMDGEKTSVRKYLKGASGGRSRSHASVQLFFAVDHDPEAVFSRQTTGRWC